MDTYPEFVQSEFDTCSKIDMAISQVTSLNKFFLRQF